MTKITKELVDSYLEANPELAQDKRNADFNAVFLPNDVSAFGISAFVNCVAMHAIRIPSEVSAIEDSCFEYCRALSNIQLPNGISAIEAKTFMNCYALQKIELPEAISAIKEYAFNECPKLTNVKIDSSVSVGNYAFAGCLQLSSIDSGNIIALGKYAFAKTALSVVKLPDVIDKIDEYAFTNCSSLVSASGNNIVSAMYGAFEVCPQLSAIDFPKLKFLGRSSFVDTGFKTLELNTVELIDDGAFNRARNLETISFPNLLSAGGEGRYYYTVFNGQWHKPYDGFPVLYEIKLPKLIYLGTGVAAQLSALSSVDLQNLERLNACEMFSDCPNLSTISLPKLNYAGGAIAYDCISLSTLELPKLSTLDSKNGLAYDCSALTSVAIPKISSLGNSLFEKCMNVASVYIDNDALHSISDGQIITPTSADNEWKWISPKIDHIANDQIAELPNGDYVKTLKYVDCASVTCCHIEFDGNKNLQFVNLPALSVVNLGFDGCENLLSLDFSGAKYLFCLPDDLYYRSYTLRNCMKLSAIKVSDELRAVGQDNDMFADTELYKKQVAEGKQVFKLNDAVCIQGLDPELQTYSDPDVKLIGPIGWYDLGSALTAIDCPNCKYINEGAFYETDVHIAKLDNVEAIDAVAFSYARLSSITCPKVKELGDEAFADTDLSDLYIPECSAIGNNAFYNSPLTSVYVANDVLHSIGNGYGMDNTLVVSDNETKLVEFARGISHIKNDTVTTLQEVFTIHSNTLVDLQLSKLDVLNEQAKISHCANLSSVSLDNVKSMSHNSIYQCDNLSVLNIPTIEEFDYQAIYNCKCLLSVIMSSLTAVPNIVGLKLYGPFYGLNPDYKVYVNADIRDTMANTGWWKKIADKIIAL